MRILDQRLYLSITELNGYGFSKDFLYTSCKEYRQGKKKSYENLLDPSDNSICLVSFDSIPEATRLEKRLPSKAELISQGLIKDQLNKDPMALDFYLNNPHTNSRARQYQLAAAYLMYAAPATVSFARGMGFPGVDGLYTTVMDMMLKEEFDFWHLTNLDRFKRKLSPFKSAIKQPENGELYQKALGSLVSGKYGLKNAAKVVSTDNQSEEIKAALIKIYADPRKFSIQDTELAYLKIAARKYEEWQQSGGKSGWDHKCFISGQTISNFLYDPENQQIWFAKRHGKAEAKNKFERNTKRIAATYANAKWVIDGTPLHRYFQDGDSAYNRVHIFFVMDEHTWCILGVGISLTGESHGQVLQALRAASQNAGIMAGDNQLYVPYEIQSDNSSANQHDAVLASYEVIGTHHRPAAVGNSKSKVVEPLNKHFFARWMKFREGFTGSMGMSTALDNKVNPDALTVTVRKKQLPDLVKTLEQLQEDVNGWNNDRSWKNADVPEADRLSPMEKYKTSLEATQAKQKTITESLSIEAFYYQPTKAKQVKDESKKSRQSKTIHIPQEYQYTNNGIKVDRISPMDGRQIKMEFDVPDPLFNERNIGKKFTLRIEPLNYDHAYLYQDGKPVMDAQGNRVKAVNKDMFHSALADHQEGEAKRLNEHEEIKKDQAKLAVSRFEYFDMKAKTAGIEEGDIINPRLFGQKEVSDPLKIAATERLVNGEKKEVGSGEWEDGQETEDRRPKKLTINRFEA